MNKAIEERIEFLSKCAKLYETDGSSPLSDAEYDKEYSVCIKECPDHDFFKNVGGIDASHVYGKIVKHNTKMGSLNKSPNIDDYDKWIRKTHKDGQKYVIEPKFDGSSITCVYKNGNLTTVITRGNGDDGVDVTENAKYVDGVKESINCDKYVEVRGELYKNRQDFYENWAAEYKNPRNFTAGSINQKDPLVTKSRGLSFVAYEVVGVDFDTEEEKLKFIKNNGFNNISDMSLFVKGTYDYVIAEVKKYMDSFDRNKLPFDIDGVVVKPNDIELSKSMGYTSDGKYPKALRAVKFPCEQKETVLVDVEWNIGRTGKLTPIGILDPVQLAGTTVSKVTLHNIKFIKDNHIDMKSVLLIQKSGDIIPYVVRKVSNGNEPLFFPDQCPSCGCELIWYDSKVTKYCDNDQCGSKIISYLDHWFKTIGVKGIGEDIITDLVTDGRIAGFGHINSISQMYALKDYECTGILYEHFGDKAFENILKAIASVKEMTLDKFIEALGIGKIGTMAKDIVDIADSIEKIDALELKDLVALKGFAEKKAIGFLDGWKSNRNEIDNILKFIKIKEKVLNSNKLAGKVFCITGTLSNGRKYFKDIIELNGGKFSSSVSAKVNYLVCGDDAGSKVDKAAKVGVEVIDENKFMNMLD